MMAKIHVTASGPVGCGKSAVLGEIEIALRAIGVPVSYADPIAEHSEKNLTHADWTAAIEMYRPEVVLSEKIIDQSVQNSSFQASIEIGEKS